MFHNLARTQHVEQHALNTFSGFACAGMSLRQTRGCGRAPGLYRRRVRRWYCDKGCTVSGKSRTHGGGVYGHRECADLVSRCRWGA